MAKGILIALMSPVSEDRDDEFNRWYNTVHGPELVSLRGFASLTRYQAKVQAVPPSPEPRFRYAAVYELDNVDEALRALAERAPALKTSGAVDFSNALGIAFEKIPSESS